jgi:hypothetical protein
MVRESMEQISSQPKLPYDKEEVIRNLYLSGIAEEFIALQLDLGIPRVIQVLKEQGIYQGTIQSR